MSKKEDSKYKNTSKDYSPSQKQIINKDDFESRAEKSRFHPDSFWDGETIYDD